MLYPFELQAQHVLKYELMNGKVHGCIFNYNLDYNQFTVYNVKASVELFDFIVKDITHGKNQDSF